MITMPDAAIMFTLRNEDCHWDTKARLENLNDGAGLTFIGLTEKYDGEYLKTTHHTDIKGLAELYKTNRPTAIGIVVDTYRHKYWTGKGFDQIKSDRIAVRLFDLAVNCGFGGLNNIMRLAGLSEKFTPEEINDLIEKLGEDSALALIKNAALSRYQTLRGWKRFSKGWTARMNKDEFEIL